MKPIEIVVGFLGIFGSPAGLILVLESPHVWQLKAIAIASLFGLLWHSFQRFRTVGIIQ